MLEQLLGLKKTRRRTNIRETFAEAIFNEKDKSLLNEYLKKKVKESLGILEKREKTAEKSVSPNKIQAIGDLEKNSSLIPGIAQNIALLRENISKLVALKTKSNFFAQQDAEEASLEASRLNPIQTTPTGPGQTTPTESGGGFLNSIMSFFQENFLEGIKSFAESGKILKLVGQAIKKIFLPLAIIGTLWSGITAGFKRYQETGSFSEAIFAGLGGSLEFLTFGLFGEDSLRKMWTALQDFMDPITETISGVFKSIKGWFVEKFGSFFGIKNDDSGTKDVEPVRPNMPNTQDGVGSVLKQNEGSESKIKDGVGGVLKNYEQDKAKKGMQGGIGSVYREASINKAKRLSSKKENLDSELKQATETAKQQKEKRKALVASGAMSPEEAKRLDNQDQSTLDGIKMKIDGAKAEIDATISSLEASGDSKTPSVSVGGPSAPASAISSGGGGGGTSASAVGGAGPSVSGGDISSASASVAEGQRMESAADIGSIINAPRTSTSAGQVGQEPDTVPEVYDESLTELLTA